MEETKLLHPLPDYWMNNFGFQMLGDPEIKMMAKPAEELVLRQRNFMSYLKSFPNKGAPLIVEETPEALALHLLNEKFPDPRWYLENDIKRLASEIKDNLSAMEWFHNLN